MKVDMEVLSVRTHGDHVEVELQGATKRQACWLPMLSWKIQVPEYVGRKYRIGQRIRFQVQP